jgi:hypothetical protein
MKRGYRGGGRKPIQIDERRAFSLHDQGFSKKESLLPDLVCHTSLC